MPQHSASPNLHKLWVLGLGLSFSAALVTEGSLGTTAPRKASEKRVFLNGICSIWLCLVTPGLEVHGDEGCWVNSVAIIICSAAEGHWG